MAEAADAGFNRAMFAHALGAADQTSDAAFAAYGVDAQTTAAMRGLFARWRSELFDS
jgi:hypothetical protein